MIAGSEESSYGEKAEKHIPRPRKVSDRHKRRMTTRQRSSMAAQANSIVGGAFRKLFARHRCFSLSYEELVACDHQEKMAALLNFLGVSPRELTTTTKKMGDNDLRRAIANFDELRSHFAGGPFSGFFENA
jgi:hypothetical protein